MPFLSFWFSATVCVGTLFRLVVWLFVVFPFFFCLFFSFLFLSLLSVEAALPQTLPASHRSIVDGHPAASGEFAEASVTASSRA